MLTSENDVRTRLQWWRTAFVASVQWGCGQCGAVGCYTLRGCCACVFGVKCGDLCGSEGTVAQRADWHSDAWYEREFIWG